jgi:large subunit ribosomal protein L25
MKVPLHFINAEIAPGVKTGGGLVTHVFTEIEISCLPKDLPEYIEVDLANAQLNTSIHLSELKLPQGVESAQLRAGDDVVVATVTLPRAEVVAEEVPAAGAAPAAAPAAAAAAAPAAAEKKEEKK